MWTVDVVHRDLDEPGTGVLEAAHHLDADDAAGAAQRHLVEERPADEPEIAVRIPHPQPERRLDEVVVHPPDDPAVQRVASGR